MKYRDLLQLYKEGKLDEKTRREIERDLEKEDAILEYLYEETEFPEIDNVQDSDDTFTHQDMKSDNSNLEAIRVDKKEDEFSKKEDELEEKFKMSLQKNIRRAFIKMGTVVGAVLLVCILFLEFVLPHVVDWFYYNPGEIVSQIDKDGYEIETNRMSLDIAVYSELFLPEKTRDNVNVIRNGYGNYDIIITQNWAYTGKSFVDVGGHIKQGRLVLYDNNTLKIPVDNVFEWGMNSLDPEKSLSEQIEEPKENVDGNMEIYNVSAAGTPEESLETIQGLKEDEFYLAYVSLEQIVSYETLLSYLDTNELSSVWCAVRTSEIIGGENIGFLTAQSGTALAWDNEKYPLLRQLGPYEEYADVAAKMKTTEGALQHLESMLNYLSEQKRFCKLINLDMNGEDIEKMKGYVSENGLQIYGFAFAADKETLQKLMETPEVYSIYVTSFQ